MYRLLLVGLIIVSLCALSPVSSKALHEHLASYNGKYLENTTIPLLKPGFFDDFASFVIRVFWVPLDSRNTASHLQAIHFYGTLSSGWLFMAVEAHKSSAGFLLATYVLEVIGELQGVGITTPIWCLLHLSRPRGTGRIDSALPIALAIGFGVPTILTFLGDPAPDVFHSQQAWLILRLFHPIFTWVIWIVLRPFASSTVSAQRFYQWVIALSAFHHVFALAPFLLALRTDWINVRLSLAETFIPPPLFVPAADFTQAFAGFLRWDETLTTLSLLIWGFALRGSQSLFQSVYTLFGGIAIAVFAGPGAAVVYFLTSSPVTDAVKKVQ